MFRKKSSHVVLVPDEQRKQTEVTYVPQEVNGDVKTFAEYKDFEVHDPNVIAQLPTIEEYRLENLLNAGIPLDEINLSSVMGITDPAQLDVISQRVSARFVEQNKDLLTPKESE